MDKLEALKFVEEQIGFSEKECSEEAKEYIEALRVAAYAIREVIARPQTGGLLTTGDILKRQKCDAYEAKELTLEKLCGFNMDQLIGLFAQGYSMVKKEVMSLQECMADMERIPLTQRQLRYMDGQEVWCEDLNLMVKIRAPKYGLIQAFYKMPGTEGHYWVGDLTLYEKKPEVEQG